jgi:hypothetical protein
VYRFRAALIAACLALSVAFAAAPIAFAHGAAPKTPPPPSVCSSYVTGQWGTINTSEDVDTQAAIQEMKNSDGTTCGEYRTVGVWRLHSGVSNRHINDRYAGMNYLPDGSPISAAIGESFSYLTATSSWQYYYGPWVSLSCNTHFLSWFVVNIVETGGYPVAYSYGRYASC